MADKKIEQMLESLVNDEVAKAEELFHEYVVAKSREIYESLIDSEIEEAAEEDEEEADLDEAAAEDSEDEDEDLDESSEEDEEMDENFDDIAIEGDDEEGMGADAGDDALGDMEMGDEEGEGEEKSEEELFQDLDAIVDELQAKFDELKGMEAGEHGMGGEEGEEGEMKDAFEPEMATVREYVEKVSDGHGAEKKGKAETADNKKSVIDNMKNDMGGTTANIVSGRDGATGSETGALKGNGVLKGKPQDMNTGNINVPGGKAGSAFSKKEPGHGAEKKGAAEQADNKQSLFRGRR